LIKSIEIFSICKFGDEKSSIGAILGANVSKKLQDIIA
jgi:hypothetical protein